MDVERRCRNPHCPTVPTPGYAPRGLCTAHERDGLQALAGLARDWSDLLPLVWDRSSAATALSTLHVPYGPRDPGDWNVDALVGEIGYTLVLWECVVREQAGLSNIPDRDHQSEAAVYRAATILHAHYTVLLAVPGWVHTTYSRVITVTDGPDAVCTFLDLHRRAQARLGVRGVVRSVPGYCPGCGRARLAHHDGTDPVTCDHCNLVMSWDQYQDMAALLPRVR